MAAPERRGGHGMRRNGSVLRQGESSGGVMQDCTIQISVFGAFDIKVDGVSQHLGVSAATCSLLQYLICYNDRPARREQLTEMFWPQTCVERRRSSLNSAIWRIKKALKTTPLLGLDATADWIRLTGVRAPQVLIDFVGLENAVDGLRGTAEPAAAGLDSLIRALDTCSGTPLDGLDDEWASIERERLSALHMRGMTIAMHALAGLHRYDEALDMGRRILVHDPYRECAFQEMLCLHVLNGERAKALQLFDRFTAALEGDLGIEPMAETRALRDYLASDQSINPSADQHLELSTIESIWQPDVGALLATIEHARDAVRTRC